MLFNERDFSTAVLPSGYHIVEQPITTVAAIIFGQYGSAGSVPVSKDRPWYSAIVEDDRDCDELTAWMHTASVRANVSPVSTDEDEVHKLLSFMVKDVVQYVGMTESTGDLVTALHAIIVGGAAYIREHGHEPVDAVRLLLEWEIK